MHTPRRDPHVKETLHLQHLESPALAAYSLQLAAKRQKITNCVEAQCKMQHSRLFFLQQLLSRIMVLGLISIVPPIILRLSFLLHVRMPWHGMPCFPRYPHLHTPRMCSICVDVHTREHTRAPVRRECGTAMVISLRNRRGDGATVASA